MDSSFNSLSSGLPCPPVMKSLRVDQITRIMIVLSSYAPGVRDIDPLIGYTQLVCGHLSPSLYSEIPPPTKIPSSERSHLTR